MFEIQKYQPCPHTKVAEASGEVLSVARTCDCMEADEFVMWLGDLGFTVTKTFHDTGVSYLYFTG